MSRIAMDPEIMKVHAETHAEVGEIVAEKLNAIPTAVDGGLASDTVAAIMQRIGGGIDALYGINGTLGEIVTAIAADAATTEEAAIAELTPIVAEVEAL